MISDAESLIFHRVMQIEVRGSYNQFHIVIHIEVQGSLLQSHHPSPVCSVSTLDSLDSSSSQITLTSSTSYRFFLNLSLLESSLEPSYSSQPSYESFSSCFIGLTFYCGFSLGGPI